jgi:hypothetical protein
LGLKGSCDHLDLSEANILSLSMSMSRDMSGKGRNWEIYMRMMNCQSLKERDWRNQFNSASCRSGNTE